jgi:hypothetical protein
MSDCRPLSTTPDITTSDRDPDWNVFDGGPQPIGRIYEDKTAATGAATFKAGHRKATGRARA